MKIGVNTSWLICLLETVSFIYGSEPQEIINAYSEAEEKSEPQNVINAYLKEADKSSTSGNVLAYKNIYNQTIVLKSGTYFSNKNQEKEEDIFIPLESIIYLTTDNAAYLNKKYEIIDKKLIVTYNENNKENPFNKSFENFVKTCETNNDNWKYNIKGKEPEIDLHNLLGQYRHTELQVQALLNSYENNSCENESNLEKKELLKALLPKILVNKEASNDNFESKKEISKIDEKIYSLFEACHACEKTAWLNKDSMKENFVFKILDAQYSCDGKWIYAKDQENSFISQQTLENFKVGEKPLKTESENYNNEKGKGYVKEFKDAITQLLQDNSFTKIKITKSL